MSRKAESQILRPHGSTTCVDFDPTEFIAHKYPDCFQGHQPLRRIGYFHCKKPDSEYEIHQAYVDLRVTSDFTFKFIIVQRMTAVSQAITLDSTFLVDMYIKFRVENTEKTFSRVQKLARMKHLRELNVPGMPETIVGTASALFDMDAYLEVIKPRQYLHGDKDNFKFDVVLRERGKELIRMETRKPGRPGNLSFVYLD